MLVHLNAIFTNHSSYYNENETKIMHSHWLIDFVKYLISLTLCKNCLTVSIKQSEIIQSYITAASIAYHSFNDKLVKNNNDDDVDDNIKSSYDNDAGCYDITQ